MNLPHLVSYFFGGAFRERRAASRQRVARRAVPDAVRESARARAVVVHGECLVGCREPRDCLRAGVCRVGDFDLRITADAAAFGLGIPALGLFSRGASVSCTAATARPGAAMSVPAAGVFRSLRSFNYRVWAIGSLVSNIGTWIQRTAQDWLVLTQLTHHDASAVGIVMSLQFGPQLLLLPWTGYAADRFDQRKLLMATQALMGEPRAPAGAADGDRRRAVCICSRSCSAVRRRSMRRCGRRSLPSWSPIGNWRTPSRSTRRRSTRRG